MTSLQIAIWMPLYPLVCQLHWKPTFWEFSAHYKHNETLSTKSMTSSPEISRVTLMGKQIVRAFLCFVVVKHQAILLIKFTEAFSTSTETIIRLFQCQRCNYEQINHRNHSGYGLSQWDTTLHCKGIILGMGSANKRRRCIITSYLIKV